MRPEPKFFSRDENYQKGIDWYLNEFFKDSPEGKINGEKSTEYFESKLFPERVISAFPKIKIIIILRDPVERAISNYWWSVKNGVEKREIALAFEDELSKKNEFLSNIQGTRPADYLYRSLYFEKLENLFNFISAEQILLIEFSHFKNEFSKVVTQLSKFLETPLVYKEKDVLLKNEANRKEILPLNLINDLCNYFKEDITMVNQKYKLSLELGTSYLGN